MASLTIEPLDDVRATLRSPDFAQLVAIDIACGIGDMPLDSMQANPVDVARSVSRTACGEIVALGGIIESLAVAVSTRTLLERVLTGVEATLAELPEEVSTVYSCENYTKSLSTSIAVTAVGMASRSTLRASTLREGDHAMLLGTGYRPPHTGELVNLMRVRELTRHPKVIQVIPVGSGGAYSDFLKISRCCGLVLDGMERLQQPGGPGLQYIVVAADLIHAKDLAVLGKLQANA